MRHLLIFALFAGTAFSALAAQPPPAQKTPVCTVHEDGHIPSTTLRRITFDLLQGLNHFYMSTVPTVTTEDPEVGFMTQLLRDNNALDLGVDSIRKYKGHPNRIVSTVARGMITGAEVVKAANTDLLTYLRRSDQSEQELKYQFALHSSKQKEGYKLIFISAAWVTGLMFDPAPQKNPSGPVRYLIAKEDRSDILDEIDRLFGRELKLEKARVQKTGIHNSMLATVQAIRDNIWADTYEQARQP